MIGRPHRHHHFEARRRRRQRQPGACQHYLHPVGVVLQQCVGQGVVVRIGEGVRQIDHHHCGVRRQRPVGKLRLHRRRPIAVRSHDLHLSHRTRRHHDAGAGIAIGAGCLDIERRLRHRCAERRWCDMRAAAGRLQHQRRDRRRMRRGRRGAAECRKAGSRSRNRIGRGQVRFLQHLPTSGREVSRRDRRAVSLEEDPSWPVRTEPLDHLPAVEDAARAAAGDTDIDGRHAHRAGCRAVPGHLAVGRDRQLPSDRIETQIAVRTGKLDDDQAGIGVVDTVEQK